MGHSSCLLSEGPGAPSTRPRLETKNYMGGRASTMLTPAGGVKRN
jgi:hypothetical protein